MMRVISTFFLAVCCVLHAQSGNLSEGISAFNHGRYSEARNLLAASARAGDKQAVVYLALTEAASDKCEESLPVLIKELKSPDRNLSRLSGLAAARCFSSAGKAASALPVVEDLKVRFRNDADVLYVAAETEMKAFNDTTFAMFQRTPSSYRVHQLSARIFEIQNRFGDAVAEYKKAIQMNPQAPDLHFRLGRAILLESHSAEALQLAANAFAAELDISPEDSASEFQLGEIAQVQRNGSQAQQHFERALKLSPRFVTAMIALATLYSHQKHYEPAIALLNRAVALQPANEAAHYALLTAYRDAGQMEKAKTEKTTLERLQKPPDGEFSDFLKKLGDKQPQP